MKVQIRKNKLKEYWYIFRANRKFTVTSKTRGAYFIRDCGLDNLYRLEKKDCKVVEN